MSPPSDPRAAALPPAGPSPAALRLVLVVGIAGISSASILIRWAGDQGAGAFTVAGWRMLYAALFVPPR